MERFASMKLSIKVIPGVSRNQIIKIDDNNYKIKLTTQPEKGQANEAMIEVLADYFGIKKNQIEIIFGLTSQKKIVEINL
jgi:uncharacterized protein (TIGR00251 family)